MRELRHFILRSSWPVILVACTLLVAAVTAGVTAWTLEASWSAAKTELARFHSAPQPAACRQIVEDCEAAVASRREREQQGASVSSPEEYLPDYGVIIACPVPEGLCRAVDPGPFAAYYVERFQSSLDIATVVLGLFVLVGLVALARLYAAENHLGWRRIALTVSPTMALVVALLAWASNLLETEEVVLAGLGGLLLGFAAPLLGRRINAWVREGFRADALASTGFDSHDQQSPTAPPISTITLRGGAGKNVAIGLGIALVCLISYLMNPGRSIQALVSALVQTAGLVFLVYFGRLVVNAIKGRKK